MINKSAYTRFQDADSSPVAASAGRTEHAIVSFENEAELIQTLYASVGQKQGFQSFLDELTNTLNATCGFLFGLQRQPLNLEYVWHTGVSDNFFEIVTQFNMVENDLVMNLAALQAPGSVQNAQQALSELSKLEPQRNWAEKYRKTVELFAHKDSAWVVLHGDEKTAIMLSIARLSDQKPFSEHELAALNHLVPHIRHAIQLYGQVDQSALTDCSLVDVLDAIPRPSIVLSNLCEVLHINHAAQRILSMENNDIWLKDKFIVLSDKALQTTLATKLVEAIKSSAKAGEYYSSSIFIPRKKLPSLILSLSPIEHGGVLLYIYDPTVRALPSAEKISHYFALTVSEARLCEDLVKGLSIKEIAQQRHKSEATLRSYLKQIFQKTGAKRQGQLVSNILGALID